MKRRDFITTSAGIAAGTSLISGHFANASNTVYLDVFSCKYYDPREVAEFAMAFFKGGHYKMQIALRQ